MYGLAYVLIPGRFDSLQSELDRTLAPFRRGGDDSFPREKLAFDDATDNLSDMHRGKFNYDPDRSVRWLGGGDGMTPLFYVNMSKLDEHMKACGLDTFEGTFAELEPDFDAFVSRFTKFDRRDPDTSRYGRWLNPPHTGTGGNWVDASTARSPESGGPERPSSSFHPVRAPDARSSAMSSRRSAAVPPARRLRSRKTWNWSQASNAQPSGTRTTHGRPLWVCRWGAALTRTAANFAQSDSTHSAIPKNLSF
jgi:hypothetical protein